ncbi:hypothetical protein DRP05_02395 [Archaeoglobales archaeon]|nr:MAG: hypothetical protein DRP05_02395 [Archaeoglobales archaeon]
MENLDQSMIDDIIASAESDTPESKLAQLEEEITEIKGSIKKLLLDIRETMNQLENPFQSLSSLAEGALGGAQKVQAVQVIPPYVEEEEDKDKEVRKEEKDEKKEKEEVREEKKEEKREKIEETGRTKGDTRFEPRFEPKIDYHAEIIEKPKLEDLKKFDKIKQIDPLALYSIMEWSKEMLSKYNKETIKELVEVFEMVGYITQEVRDIVLKIIELISRNGDLDRAVIDLYKLYNILNPEDISLDSKVLKLLLSNERS